MWERFLSREPRLSSTEKKREDVMGSLHQGGTVGATLITAIKRFADRPAIADTQTRWTYRELGQAAGRLVALFRSLGLKKGDGVALLATNRVETGRWSPPPR
jgi:fatty-acyl-CoA synthase